MLLRHSDQIYGYWVIGAFCLLLGLSSAAYAENGSQTDYAPTNQPQKWFPHVEVLAGPGSERTLGSIDLFAPLSQDEDSLFFANFRGTFTNEISQEGNFGLGYRQIIPGGLFGMDTIFGIYGFFDFQNSDYDNTFMQATLGGELISENIEFRANAYLPDDELHEVDGSGSGGITLSGTNVISTGATLVESALPGFDVEVGTKLRLFDAALRLNGGYFHFERDNTVLRGPSFRAELEFDDLFGWQNAKLAVGGEIRSDSYRGTTSHALARLRIPLNAAAFDGDGPSHLTGIDRLMTRRIYRDDDIVTPVVEDGGSVPAGNVTDAISGEDLNVFFVADSAQGTGDCSTVADSCEFATAQGLAGAGDTFIPVDIAGQVGSVFELDSDRQQVAGAGDNGQASIMLTNSAQSTLMISGLGGRPDIAGVDLNNFADARISGISTFGPTGIQGDGFTGSVLLSDIQSDGGAFSLVNSSANVTVEDVAISNPASGLQLHNLTGDLTFADVDFTTSGTIGIDIDGGSANFSFDSESSLTQSSNNDAFSVQNGHSGTLTYNGTIMVTNGDGLQFNDADGTYNFSQLDGNLITLDGTSNAADTGIDILNDSAGTFTFAGTLANPIQITNDQGVAVNFADSPGELNLVDVTINQSNGAGIQAANSGTLDIFSAIINDTASDAINVTNTNLRVDTARIGEEGQILGDGIEINNTDGTSRTADIIFNNIFGLSAPDPSGRGIFINAQSGTLTADLLANFIATDESTIQTRDGGGANNLILSMNGNSTLSTNGVFPVMDITGSGLNSTIVTEWDYPNQVIGGLSSSSGILFDQVTFDSDGNTTNGFQQVVFDGGSLDIGAVPPSTIQRVEGDGLTLLDTRGDLRIDVLNIANQNGIGLRVDASGLSNTFNLYINGGTIDTTGGAASTQFGSAITGGGNVTMNGIIINNTGGATVAAGNSTLAGTGNTAATFSCINNGGNTGSLSFNSGANTCP